MPPLSLEDRVNALEEKLAQMQPNGVPTQPTKPWQRTIGQFECLKEVFDEAMKLREKDRERTRKIRAKKAT